MQRCAESLCLSAVQILREGCVGCARKHRSPLNDQWCNDMSQLICGVWRCRLRAWCAPISSVCTVYGGAHCWGPARPRCARSGEVCPSAAPRNWYWPVQICACARCKNSVQGCAESRCLRAAQILRSPLNDQRCNDVSPLICGVWWCRLRAWCAPICSVLHVYGGAHCWGPARPRFACSGEVRRAPQL